MKYSRLALLLSALLLAGIVSISVAGNSAKATSASTPKLPCKILPSQICAAFSPGDLSSNTYTLKNGTQTRVTLAATHQTIVWDTHAPVVLGAVASDGTSCAASTTTKNQPGSVLFIQTYASGQQWLYLVFNGQQLQRPLVAATQTGNGDVTYLKASSPGTDGDPSDYFVEFVHQADALKAYRVEAFPHLADKAPPVTPCDKERPDQQVLTPIPPAALKPNENTTGEGNEPIH
jgi:hypothetical protein